MEEGTIGVAVSTSWPTSIARCFYSGRHLRGSVPVPSAKQLGTAGDACLVPVARVRLTFGCAACRLPVSLTLRYCR